MIINDRAGRRRLDMPAGRRGLSLGSARFRSIMRDWCEFHPRERLALPESHESPLDGTRIFSAMSPGLRSGPQPGAHPHPRLPPAGPRPSRQRASQRHRARAEEGLETVYQDRTLTCRDCAEEFVFSAGEQAFYASKSLQNDPQRCPSCRAAAKRARSSDGPREFHAAICGACGGQAVVPFAPRNDRPVYCSSCFDKVRAGTLEAPPVHA